MWSRLRSSSFRVGLASMLALVAALWWWLEGSGTIVLAQPRPLRVVIVGAGLAGLSAAAELRRSGGNVEVLVLEAQPYVGGRVVPVLPLVATAGGHVAQPAPSGNCEPVKPRYMRSFSAWPGSSSFREQSHTESDTDSTGTSSTQRRNAVVVDAGATFVHGDDHTNPLMALARRYGLPTQRIDYDSVRAVLPAVVSSSPSLPCDDPNETALFLFGNDGDEVVGDVAKELYDAARSQLFIWRDAANVSARRPHLFPLGDESFMWQRSCRRWMWRREEQQQRTKKRSVERRQQPLDGDADANDEVIIANPLSSAASRRSSAADEQKGAPGDDDTQQPPPHWDEDDIVPGGATGGLDRPFLLALRHVLLHAAAEQQRRNIGATTSRAPPFSVASLLVKGDFHATVDDSSGFDPTEGGRVVEDVCPSRRQLEVAVARALKHYLLAIGSQRLGSVSPPSTERRCPADSSSPESIAQRFASSVMPRFWALLSWHFYWEVVQDQIAPLDRLQAREYDASSSYAGHDRILPLGGIGGGVVGGLLGEVLRRPRSTIMGLPSRSWLDPFAEAARDRGCSSLLSLADIPSWPRGSARVVTECPVLAIEQLNAPFVHRRRAMMLLRRRRQNRRRGERNAALSDADWSFSYPDFGEPTLSETVPNVRDLENRETAKTTMNRLFDDIASVDAYEKAKKVQVATAVRVRWASDATMGEKSDSLSEAIASKKQGVRIWLSASSAAVDPGAPSDSSTGRREAEKGAAPLMYVDADAVIVTVPLGVLQKTTDDASRKRSTKKDTKTGSPQAVPSHDHITSRQHHQEMAPTTAAGGGGIVFSPPLPRSIRRSWNTLRCAATMKILLQFDRPCWPLDTDYFGLVGNWTRRDVLRGSRDDANPDILADISLFDNDPAEEAFPSLLGDGDHIEIFNLAKYLWVPSANQPRLVTETEIDAAQPEAPGTAVGLAILVLEVEGRYAELLSRLDDNGSGGGGGVQMVRDHIMPRIQRAFPGCHADGGIDKPPPPAGKSIEEEGSSLVGYFVNNYLSNPHIRCGFSFWPAAAVSRRWTAANADDEEEHHPKEMEADEGAAAEGHRHEAATKGIIRGSAAGSGDDNLVSRGPAYDGRVWFAGEHTTPYLYANMHGALMEGQRTARAVLREWETVDDEKRSVGDDDGNGGAVHSSQRGIRDDAAAADTTAADDATSVSRRSPPCRADVRECAAEDEVFDIADHGEGGSPPSWWVPKRFVNRIGAWLSSVVPPLRSRVVQSVLHRVGMAWLVPSPSRVAPRARRRGGVAQDERSQGADGDDAFRRFTPDWCPLPCT